MSPLKRFVIGLAGTALGLLVGTSCTGGTVVFTDDGGAGEGGGGGGGASATTTSAGVGGGGDGGFGPCDEPHEGECLSLEVPLFHDEPDGETIQVYVARHLAGPNSKRQLWLLAGGPGQGGAVWQPLSGLASLFPDTDIYVIDHRGVGLSHPLNCKAIDEPDSGPLDADDVEACLVELEAKGDRARLPYFTVTQAAHDLIEAIGVTRKPDQDVYIWGGSYGTFWAHRMMQLAPNLATGIIFDGPTTPQGGLWEAQREAEWVGEHFAELCGNTPGCAQRFGNDPTPTVRSIFAKLDAIPCYGITGPVARRFAVRLLDSVRTLPLVFPFLYRTARCSPALDVVPLTHLFDTYGAIPGGVGGGFWPVTFYHINLNERWDPAGNMPTAEALDEEFDNFTWQTSRATSRIALQAAWPEAIDDYSQLPLPVESTTLQFWAFGAFDTRTPTSQVPVIDGLYNGPNVQITIYDNGGHTPVSLSPQVGGGPSCGVEMTNKFLSSGALPDESCLTTLEPVVTSAPTAEYALKWWGTENDWGDASLAPKQGDAAANAYWLADPKRRVGPFRFPSQTF